jgi:hypothetical protein
MDDHSRGFVDDNDITVLVQDGEREIFGNRGGRRRLGNFNLEDLPRSYGSRRT